MQHRFLPAERAVSEAAAERLRQDAKKDASLKSGLFSCPLPPEFGGGCKNGLWGHDGSWSSLSALPLYLQLCA